MDGREAGAVVVGMDDRLPLARAALYGLQHVTAMFAGLIAVLLGSQIGVAAMFGAVIVGGIGQLRGIDMTQREVLIFATAIGLGLGLGLAEEAALERLPAGLRVLLHSGVIVGGVVAILLNEILPGRRGEGRPGG